MTGPWGTGITFQPITGVASAVTTMSWMAKPSA
jgi:hypothetical protein